MGKQKDEEWELVREKKTEGKKGRGGRIRETESRQQDDIVKILRQRGRNMTEDRAQKDIGVKIIIYRQYNAKSLDIRSKMMELLRLCQEADDTTMMVNGPERYQQGTELPVRAEFITAFTVYQDRNGRVGMHTTISTKRFL